MLTTSSPPQGNDTPAYILAALTAGGGLTGYIRTGSVPSVAAGLTVGALVRPLLSSPPLLSPPPQPHLTSSVPLLFLLPPSLTLLVPFAI
jgi:hypothetical protein